MTAPAAFPDPTHDPTPDPTPDPTHDPVLAAAPDATSRAAADATPDATPDAALSRPERWLRDHYPWCALAVVTALAANEANLYGSDLRHWDWLLVTGLVALLVAARIALTLPDRVHETLDRLARRNTLRADPQVLDRFEADLHGSARRSALWWSGVVPLAVLAGWVAAKRGDVLEYAVIALIQAVFAAVLAGPFVGRAVAYGRLGTALRRARLQLVTESAHLDGAAGLRPVGDLYLFQASVLLVPALYLAAWWYAFPLFGTRYLEWRGPYVGLLAFAVALQALAFLWPLWAFHGVMTQQKERHLAEADEIARQADAFRRDLATAIGELRSGLADRLAACAERYATIEAMPTWPVNATLRRRFTVRNLVLVVPLLAQAAGVSGQWQRLLQALQQVIGS